MIVYAKDEVSLTKESSRLHHIRSLVENNCVPDSELLRILLLSLILAMLSSTISKPMLIEDSLRDMIVLVLER